MTVFRTDPNMTFTPRPWEQPKRGWELMLQEVNLKDFTTVAANRPFSWWLYRPLDGCTYSTKNFESLWFNATFWVPPNFGEETIMLISKTPSYLTGENIILDWQKQSCLQDNHVLF